MLLGLIIWFLPWYTLGFVSLAFLPRWYFLFPAGALALALTISLFTAEAHHDSGLGEIGRIVAVFLAVGFASGFLARAVVLIDAARRWKSNRPAIVLPIVFVMGASVFLGYFAFAR